MQHYIADGRVELVFKRFDIVAHVAVTYADSLWISRCSRGVQNVCGSVGGADVRFLENGLVQTAYLTIGKPYLKAVQPVGERRFGENKIDLRLLHHIAYPADGKVRLGGDVPRSAFQYGEYRGDHFRAVARDDPTLVIFSGKLPAIMSVSSESCPKVIALLFSMIAVSFLCRSTV